MKRSLKVMAVRGVVAAAMLTVLGGGPAGAAPGGGAQVLLCADFSHQDSSGRFVLTPSGNLNFTCNEQTPSGVGAVVVECGDVVPGQSGRFIVTPTGHFHGHCVFPE